MLLGIQADDLTGACDAGAPFAARGLSTLVVVPDTTGARADPAPEPAVRVVDTESRGLPADRARARARTAAAALASAGPAVLYKKMDSTARGHVGAELAGVLEGAGLAATVVAPAFPAQARTVVNGQVRVAGRLLDAAAMPGAELPGTGASLLALLAVAGLRPVGGLPLETVRRGRAATVARIGRFLATGGRGLVVDAETDRELDVVAAAADGAPVLLAGSAGLAAALAARLVPAPPPAPPRLPLARPILIVAGSPHPATRGQLDLLAGRADVSVLAPSRLEAGSDPGRRRAVAGRLAADARRAIERARPGTLVLTGGETAIAVVEALQAAGLRLAGEVEPGLAAGTLSGGPFDGLVTITKAGGFGDPHTLVRLCAAAA